MSARFRDTLVNLINEINAESIVEVGVKRGNTIKHILEATNIKEYYAIDPWAFTYRLPWSYTAKNKIPSIVEQQTIQKGLDKQALTVYRHTTVFPQLVVIRLPSLEATQLFNNYKTFDIVFIDADHNYECVKADILAWEPLVNRGGILCGHDYASREKGVIRAVNEIYGIDSIEVIQPGSLWVKRIK